MQSYNTLNTYLVHSSGCDIRLCPSFIGFICKGTFALLKIPLVYVHCTSVCLDLSVDVPNFPGVTSVFIYSGD